MEQGQSKPPAGNRRDLASGGKTRREYQVQPTFLGQRGRFFLGDDLSGNRLFHQPVRIDAAAIVRDLDHDLIAGLARRDTQITDVRLSRGQPLGRRFNTVIDRVTHDMGERSEEHTSELQSLMSISYAVFCLKKKKYTT